MRSVIMALLVLAGGALSMWRDDRLEGFGRDGQALGRFAASPADTPPWELVPTRTVRPDVLHRAAPALIVAGVQEAAGIARADDNVRRGFQILNLVCLVLAAALWGSIRRIGPAASWLGFVLLFLNFAAAKAAWAEPTTADAAAFLVGMAALRAHFARGDGWLLACAALAALVAPLLFLACLVLWALRGATPGPAVDGKRIATLLAGATFLGLIWAHPLALFRPLRNSMPVDPESLGIAVLVAVAWIYLGARGLLDGLTLPRVRTARLVVAAVALVVVEGAVRGLSKMPFYPAPFAHALVHSCARAGLFFVAHVAWTGPLLLVTVLRWRAVAAAVRAEGLAPVFLLLLVESLDPTTRGILWGLPFVACFTLVAIERELDWRIAALLAGGAFVASRVWFTLGLADTFVTDGIGDHVRQHYFMAEGPYMHADGYALQGALIIQGFFLLYLLLRHE